MYTYKDIAELLFPEVKITVKELLERYPERKLPENALVTRFAPSPTGYVHIGGVYQTVINSYLAHRDGGVFMLRVEDTDKKREVEGSADLIYPMLKKIGIKIDEGYVSKEEDLGEYGPYLQSRRTEYYQAFAKDLVARGLAYPCFCTEEEEEVSRCEQQRLSYAPGYYGRWAKCRNLSYEQVKENLDAGKTFKIRIKSDGDGTEKVVCNDLLRGEVYFPVNNTDYVILKSDKTALYHLAHLVDDTLMRTTTVIRDESWLPSVPLHLQLFRYMNLPCPNYLHTAQVMTVDKNTGAVRKISKRYDEWADSRWFFNEGYPVKAIQEYLLTLINSNFEEWRKENPFADSETFPLSIDKMSKSGAIFDLEKLNNISKDVISKMSKDELFDLSYAWAKEYDKKLAELIERNPEYYKSIINIERESLKPRKDFTTFKDIYTQVEYMYDDYYDGEVTYDFKKITDKAFITELVDLYLNEYYDEKDDNSEWFNKVKELCERLGYASNIKEYKKNPDAYKGNVADISTALRVVFTTRSCTPNLAEIMLILGKDKIMERVMYFKKNYNG